MENYAVKCNNKKGLTEIVFSGQLVINNIEKIIENVRTNLKKVNTRKFIVKDVENVDLTFVQMLYSLKKSGEKEGIESTLSISVSDDLQKLLTSSGFTNLIFVKK